MRTEIPVVRCGDRMVSQIQFSLAGPFCFSVISKWLGVFRKEGPKKTTNEQQGLMERHKTTTTVTNTGPPGNDVVCTNHVKVVVDTVLSVCHQWAGRFRYRQCARNRVRISLQSKFGLVCEVTW
jgi:hypothetical protein